jgi:hypothetical protein
MPTQPNNGSQAMGDEELRKICQDTLFLQDDYPLDGVQENRLKENAFKLATALLAKLQQPTHNAGSVAGDAIAILGAIIRDLPTNRDWLDPDVERAAKSLLATNPQPKPAEGYVLVRKSLIDWLRDWSERYPKGTVYDGFNQPMSPSLTTPFDT